MLVSVPLVFRGSSAVHRLGEWEPSTGRQELLPANEYEYESLTRHLEANQSGRVSVLLQELLPSTH